MAQTPAPRPEMLWEAADPDEVLRTRFGFADTQAVLGWVRSVLQEYWGIRVDSCARIVMSDRNALAWVGTPSGPLVAKWSLAADRFPRLVALADLTVWLERHGVPVSSPLATPSGHRRVETEGVSISLQREIAGGLLDVTDPVEVRAAGQTLARLHDALAAYPSTDQLPVPHAACEPLAAQIRTWLDAGAEPTDAVARETLRRLVAAAPAEPLPMQLVHGDFRSANILCREGRVAAVIDVEEVRWDHRIVEVARSTVLLGTCFHDWGPVTSEVRSQFLDGYRSVGALTRAEAAWWDVLVLWISLTMTPTGEDPLGWGAAASAHLGQVQ